MDRFATLRQGLIGAWCPSLGATGYTLLDRSGRTNHGTLTNLSAQTPWVASGGGMALRFPGASSPSLARYVSTTRNDNAYLAGSFSACAWVSYSGAVTANYPGIVCHSGANDFGVGFAIGIIQSTATANQNSVYAYISDGTKSGPSVLELSPGNTGAWACYCMVRDSAQSLISLYKNGVFQGSASTSSVTGSLLSNLPLVIGFRTDRQSFGTTINTLNGSVDDVRVYNRALAPAEIRLLASQRGIGLVPTGRTLTKFPTTLYQNVGGVWKPTTPQINVGGTWKAASPAINVGGVWKS